MLLSSLHISCRPFGSGTLKFVFGGKRLSEDDTPADVRRFTA